MAETSPNFSYQVGGSLPANSSTYIDRQADEQFYQGLKAGELCYVLNSRQMGKSSLRVRTMQRLQAENIVCAAIDLTAIGTSDITAEEWYAGLIDSIVSSLNLYDHFDLDEWWTKNQRLSNVRRWNKFIESVLLSKINQNIVIFIDEIDSILRLNFNVDDFFASIRACYNKRAEHPDFNRLTFALLGVATPNDLITNQHHSTPFNIGQAIELTGFKFEEAKPLALGFIQKSTYPEIVLQEVLSWTGGQPFLTQKVCQLVRLSEEIIPEGEEKEWVEKLVRSRIIENWEANDEPEHLRTIRDRLLWGSEKCKELLKLYHSILQEGWIESKEELEYLNLRLTGIVVKNQEKLEICNYIYREIFDFVFILEKNPNLFKKILYSNNTSSSKTNILDQNKINYEDSSLFKISINSSTLIIKYCDITTLAVDVIVTSDDTYLSMSGGVSQAILQAGGEAINQEVRTQTPIPLGNIVVTEAYRLKAKKIFHAAVLELFVRDLTTCELIESVTKKCLVTCNSLKFSSIAFPALATGVGRLPQEESALAMIKQIILHLTGKTTISLVVIALYTRWGLPNESLRFQNTVKAYLKTMGLY